MANESDIVGTGWSFPLGINSAGGMRSSPARRISNRRSALSFRPAWANASCVPRSAAGFMNWFLRHRPMTR